MQRIHRQSGGNPFYSLHLAQASDPDGLPTSLRDVIESRLVAADPAGLPAMERTAVVGPAARSSYDDGGALDAAVAAGLLVEDGDEVRFAHPLLATAAYGRLTTARRRGLHRQAAAASAPRTAPATWRSPPLDPTQQSLPCWRRRPGWPVPAVHPRQPPSWPVTPCF